MTEDRSLMRLELNSAKDLFVEVFNYIKAIGEPEVQPEQVAELKKLAHVRLAESYNLVQKAIRIAYFESGSSEPPGKS